MGRRIGKLVVLVASLLLLIAGAGPAASQSQPSAPRGFDFWQPDWMVRELWGPGKMPKDMMVRLLRHTTYMQYGLPKDYEGAKSDVPAGPQTIAAGARLYGAHCAVCHGRDGMGDGEPGRSLSPSPALLAYMIRKPIAVDEYLLWTISEGGKQFESEMPAFKEALSRADIWRMIAFMRAGFPDASAPRQ